MGNEKFEKVDVGIKCEILLIEHHPDEHIMVTAAIYAHNIFMQLIHKDINEIAGELCKGIYTIQGFDIEKNESLCDTFAELNIDSIDNCLHPKGAVIARDSADENNYITIRPNGGIEIKSREELRPILLDYPNVATNSKCELVFSNGYREIPTLSIAPTLRKKADAYQQYEKFCNSLCVQGRVLLENDLSRSLVHCVIKNQTNSMRSVVLPSLIRSIRRDGLQLDGGRVINLGFNPNLKLDRDSIRILSKTRINTLKMTSTQMANSELAFLYGGEVEVRKLALSTFPTEAEMNILMASLYRLYHYVSLDGFSEGTGIPKRLMSKKLLSIEVQETKESQDLTEAVFDGAKTIARILAKEFELLISDFQDEYEDEYDEDVLRYIKTVIEHNCEMLQNTFILLLQPFCKADLTSDSEYSIYQLGSALNDEATGTLLETFTQ